ncbi:DUF3307 domain-containing protein [Wenyingzhuangia marina]|uniref:DUF3307 domain-containing protein n=1 Tax=Wenyingzhuangia marina TaxID=1195760 RepID=A0A1M5VKZ8_9FLAO|nr:DUF3307 domain-containing protein [Wenyingzhuangia marina]GGF71532.1 hypothetical protein GCM10011397_13120 [Wenyingzhuangia marina]SHH75724.1 Protein of unknown function [Wenyingzhuangia marina]
MLVLKLLIAHVLGDFVLQPNKWVKHKERKKWASKYLYIHTAIHALLLLIVLGFQIKYLWKIIIISISHLVIDGIKLLKPIKNSRILFFADQIAHLTVIGLVVRQWSDLNIDFSTVVSEQNLLLVLSLLLLTSVTSIVLKVVFSVWNKEIEEVSKEDSSLKNAGKYIGILERLFVFAFVVLNQWQAIGFLLAAKSVFRFGDLTKAKDRKLTEYILVGTLLSFGIAIVIGLTYQYLSF